MLLKSLITAASLTGLAGFLAACGASDSGDDAGVADAVQDPALVEAGRAAAERAREEAGNTDADGVITATIDGQPRTWYVVSGSELAYWESLDGGGASVTILGYADPADTTWKQAMEVGFEARDMDEGLAVSHSLVTYYSSGATRHHTTGRQQESSVVVTHWQRDGNTIEVSGTFSGTLRYKDWGGDSSEQDPEDIEISDGAFHASIAGD